MKAAALSSVHSRGVGCLSIIKPQIGVTWRLGLGPLGKEALSILTIGHHAPHDNHNDNPRCESESHNPRASRFSAGFLLKGHQGVNDYLRWD